MTRWSHHVLPSGMVISLPMPEFEMTYSTYVMPTQPIPLMSSEELRGEAAAKVLAVFREHGVDPERSPDAAQIVEAGHIRVRRLKREPPPEFAGLLGKIPFELEFPPREPSRLDLYGALPAWPVLPWSGII